MQVVGVGTVKLTVQSDPNNEASTKAILLTNVLHIPAMTYNIICEKRMKADPGLTLNVVFSTGPEENTNFPNGRVEDLRSTGVAVIAYFRNIRRPPPLHLFPNQVAPPAVCLVKLAHATPGCTLGVSNFQQMLDSAQAWFEWITVPQEEQRRLEKDMNDAAASDIGRRPHTQLSY